MGDRVTTFDSGAQRISDCTPRYCDIPPVVLRRIAMIFNEGAVKYGVGNWKKGLPWDDTYNHLQEHINRYNEGDRTEDHLAKAAWGLLVQMSFDARMDARPNPLSPEKAKETRRKLYNLPVDDAL